MREPPAIGASTRRLVVVEDEPELAEIFEELFSDAPWETLVCRDAAQARAAMDRGVDVLLTDKNLPDGSGLDLVARARAISDDVEVLLITGFASLDTAIEALQLGVFDYIVKPPPSVFDVRRKVEQAFARQRVIRENRALLAALEERNEALTDALATLERTRDDLVRAEKLAGIGTLAAGIAHEIGSPLFGVMGLAEAIEDEQDMAVIREHAREIVRYAGSIKQIVADLGLYTRRHDPAKRRVDVGEEIRAAVRMVQRARDHGEVTLDVSVEDGVVIWARPTALQQVVVNLVRNAWDALGEEGGTIAVRMGETSDGVWLEVEDDGAGIPRAQQGEVFDPFFTTKEPGEGTGLGLHVVYRIVTRHHGTIHVRSEPGRGATFVVRLPRGEPYPDTADTVGEGTR